VSSRSLRVRVEIEPAEMRLRIASEFDGQTAHIEIQGVVDREELDKFRRGLAEALSVNPRRVEFHLCKLTEITRPAINELLFQRTKIGLDVDFVLVGSALPEVTQALVATDAFLLDTTHTCPGE
jgi:hypothetical protein